MKRIGMTVWCLLLSSVAIAQSNQQEDWIQLFNGEDLDDWPDVD